MCYAGSTRISLTSFDYCTCYACKYHLLLLVTLCWKSYCDVSCHNQTQEQPYTSFQQDDIQRSSMITGRDSPVMVQTPPTFESARAFASSCQLGVVSILNPAEMLHHKPAKAWSVEWPVFHVQALLKTSNYWSYNLAKHHAEQTSWLYDFTFNKADPGCASHFVEAIFTIQYYFE